MSYRTIVNVIESTNLNDKAKVNVAGLQQVVLYRPVLQERKSFWIDC